MAHEDKGPWWVVGVQIHAAMDPTQNRVEAFLAEHAGQATDACLEFLRTIPAGVEVDLAPLVERLREQILAHTRFLCGQADLSATQAERLMAASCQGYDRFAGAFRAEILEGRGRPGAGLLPGIEAALANGGGNAPPPAAPRAPAPGPRVTSSMRRPPLHRGEPAEPGDDGIGKDRSDEQRATTGTAPDRSGGQPRLASPRPLRG